MHDAQQENARALPPLVVAVGAAAGGLDGFKALLGAVPSRSGMTFLFVQHLAAQHEGPSPELLAPCTDMPVREAEHGAELAPDTVYLIRPGTALRDGRIELSHGQRDAHLPIDHLFASVAREYRHHSAAIVLSGTGSDGSGGLRSIGALGGLAITQKPGTDDRPGVAADFADTGCADLVLEISEMPAALQRFHGLPPAAKTIPSNPAALELMEGRAGATLNDEELERVVALLSRQTRVDFSLYRSATIGRRILRRMVLSGFDELSPYLEHLHGEPAEQRVLARDMMIGVTEFFRDPEAFERLRELVIDPLVAAAEASLRVWVPACATGEEAYSIAMAFLEAIALQGRPLTLRVFATDVDGDALRVARAGIYALPALNRLGSDRLQRFFVPVESGGFRVRSGLRDLVSFAEHDVTRDAPFSRMDLVSCRNMLIYLTPDTQQRVLRLLHFALSPGHYLFLGDAETAAYPVDLFQAVCRTQRIYRKVGASGPIGTTSAHPRASADAAGSLAGRGDEAGARPAADLARRFALEAFAPPMLIIAENGEIVFSHGNLDPFVQLPRGDYPRLELGTILRPELATRIRGLIHQCRRDQAPVRSTSIIGNPRRSIHVEVRPAPAIGSGAVLIAFPIGPEPFGEVEATGAAGSGDTGLLQQVERELRATQEDLHSTVEELESANEELRSSSEQTTTMNEELQSANEELEATSEELRSLNEELMTVNAQLREKIEQLEHAHDDLNNFFASTRIATLFLDEQQRIKRFTPAAQAILDLGESDLGRRTGDIAREMLAQELGDDSRAVLEDRSPRSREVRHGDGRWFERHVLPYRTTDRRVDGLVVTWVDISDLKSASDRLRLRERQQSVIAELGVQALRELHLQAYMDRVVRDIAIILECEYAKILELQPGERCLLLRAGTGWHRGLVGAIAVETASGQAAYTLQTGQPVILEDLSSETRFSGPQLLADHQVVSGLSCVVNSGGRPFGVLSVHSRRPRKFSRQDVNFLQAVANVLGIAIERQQTRRRLALELGVTRALKDQRRRSEALDTVLEVMARHLPTAMGVFSWATGDARLLRGQIHCADRDERETLEGVLPPEPFAPGEDLVGVAFRDGRAVWATDFGVPSLFTGGRDGAARGFLSGVALPIRIEGATAGVLCMYSRERIVVDDVSLHSLEALGSAIGDSIARSRVEEQARALATIVQASNDAIFSYTPMGRVTRWLPGAERLFGYRTEEMLGESVESIMPADEWRRQRRKIDALARGHVPEVFEAIRLRKDGEAIAVSVQLTVNRSSDGALVELVSIDRDLSLQKQSEEKLRAADRQKDMFLATLSHELRNPLAAIRNAAESLKLSAPDDPAVRSVQAILERQSSHMSRLLGDLLDVARIVGDKIPLDTRVLDLGRLCGQILDDRRHQLVHRSLELTYDAPGAPVWVDADPVRISQVIENLISNAVKYTDDGGEISLSLTTSESTATLTVRDTGIGVAPAALESIFELFHQSEQDLGRSEGGLGLGLPLARSLVELHGGEMRAHSEGRGTGSEFRVRLPLCDQKSLPAAKPATAPGPLQILIIEDNVDAAEALRQVLSLSGHEVAVATRGDEGVELAAALSPEVILCDLGLPGSMSGFDVARRLSGSSKGDRPWLVAVSGYGRPEDVEQSMQAGFAAHLTKPMDMALLERTLSALIRQQGGAGGEL